MFVYSLLVLASWLRSAEAEAQHINTGGPGADMVLEPMDMLQYPIAYNIPTLTHNIVSDAALNTNLDLNRYTRVPRHNITKSSRSNNIEKSGNKKDYHQRLPTPLKGDKTTYSKPNNKFRNRTAHKTSGPKKGKKPMSFINARRHSLLADILDNRGAKQMWLWRRQPRGHEPRMPRIPAGLARAAAAGWANKRRNQLVYKPGVKGVPPKFIKESNYNGMKLHQIPQVGTKYPITIFSLGNKYEKFKGKMSHNFNSLERLIPFKFNRGHKNIAVDLKKDNKRKVKFSTWPGKKFPPIIGPIWIPTSQVLDERKLNTLVLKFTDK